MLAVVCSGGSWGQIGLFGLSGSTTFWGSVIEMPQTTVTKHMWLALVSFQST